MFLGSCSHLSLFLYVLSPSHPHAHTHPLATPCLTTYTPTPTVSFITHARPLYSYTLDKDVFLEEVKKSDFISDSDEAFAISLFDALDLSGNNSVNLKEYCTALSMFVSEKSLGDSLEIVFQLYDLKGSDGISSAEMVSCYSCHKTARLPERVFIPCVSFLTVQARYMCVLAIVWCAFKASLYACYSTHHY